MSEFVLCENAENSCGAAPDGSPQRKLWELGGKAKPRTGRKKKCGATFFRRSAARFAHAFTPTAYAVGYPLTPLRG